MKIAVASSADTPFAEKVGRKARICRDVTESWYYHFQCSLKKLPEALSLLEAVTVVVVAENCQACVLVSGAAWRDSLAASLARLGWEGRQPDRHLGSRTELLSLRCR